MHHLHPSSKGDQLCPLGFHPQVRWPTRCKRCFRDYKEHGGKRGGDDVAASSPSLSDSSHTAGGSANRIWTSTQNLSAQNDNNNGNENNNELRKRPLSWTSTPDLDKKNESHIIIKKIEDVETSLIVQIPQRRHTTTLDAKELEESFTMRRPPIPPTTPTKDASEDITIFKTDSLAERVRKMNLLKKQNSLERESSRERSVPREKSLPRERSKIESEPTPPREAPIPAARDPKKRLSLPEPELATKKREATEIPIKKELSPKLKKTAVSFSSAGKKDEDAHRKDIQFLMHIKDKNQSEKQDDSLSLTTENTDNTITGEHRSDELKEEIRKLQSDLSVMKTRAERAEREKSDLLLRRLASLDTGTNRTAASEALKLQQKVNELKGQVEELRDDKKNLSLKVRDMEQDLKNRTTKSVEDDLIRKLRAAEQLCEELMDENSDIKKELRGIETEMDEMHDNFREDQAAEYSNLKKDLDLATKNCRILSFKLKKSDRKIESLEMEKQAQTNIDLINKVKKLEDDLKLANELSRRLQIEADQHKDNPVINKKAPLLGVVGKSTSADGRYSRASLTRGGSQEDPQQLLRDLQDSMEREADLKEQLKFAEEEAENVRKKATRIEDENESLMMQLKKMASRARSRKLSPTPPSRLTPEPPIDRDEGISDEDDPAELRVLLELNEQEAAVLRLKVEDLENENKENKNQIKELQEKLKTTSTNSKKSFSSLLSSSKNSATATNEKKLKMLEDELAELRKSIIEKDRSIEQLQAEIKVAKAAKKPLGITNNLTDINNIDAKKQLQVVEQEALILRNKIISLEKENEKMSLENKKLLMQSIRKNSIPTNISDTNAELIKIKDSLQIVEMERDLLKSKLKVMRLEAENILPPHIPKEPTEMITRPTLKKWVEELENEIYDLRTMLWNCSAEKQTKLENENDTLQKELKNVKEKLGDFKNGSTLKESSSKITELEQKIKKSEDETKKMSTKTKELEEKIKRQESLVKNTESSKSLIDAQLKREKEKSSALEKDLDKEKKDRQKSETKVTELNDELSVTKKNLDKIKSTLEKEVKELKLKVGSSSTAKTDISPSATTKQLQEMRKQNEDLLGNIAKEMKKYTELNAKYESIAEENILMKAQLAMEKKNLDVEKNSTKQHLFDMDKLKLDKSELNKKLKDAEKKIKEIEARSIKSGASEYEKTMLKNNLAEKDVEYLRLKKENEMNIEIVFQLRKENDDLTKKFNDFERINKVQSSMNDHNQNLEAEIRKLRIRLENVELNSKSEVASTRLRYEQQVKNLNVEINAMQRQCERFKKDRDAFKQLLESAQKQIGDLKQNSGRQSRGSMHSGDEDDLKGKILFLEQQIGCLEDQLCESRLDASKYKNQMISQRTANEIKISEMTSKLNEFEEERLIATGRSKIAGMKTKLELSWQKEREEQQRILQETSTLARDLRQTLFEVERERDKERLELKRKLDQLKKSQEEELEEGRKKVSELQCDLLELRDAHAKIRTSNEKLRRERERNEKDLAKRRMEHDGERKVGALLQTVDELVKIAPELKMAANNHGSSNRSNNLKPEPVVNRRSRSPSPSSASQISNVLARLAEASEQLRKYQQNNEDENERNRVRRGNLRRASSTENDGTNSSGVSRTPSTGKLSRLANHNGSLIRKSLSLDQANKQDQSIWRQEDGSMSSIQSIESEMGGLVRESDLDSRLSGGSTQSDVPRGPRKKKRGIMGKLRSLTKSGRHTESEGSIQGSDSDVSMSSDIRSSKKDLRNRLSGMFKRAGSVSSSTEKMLNDSEQRPVAVTIVGGADGPKPLSPPTNATTPKSINRTSTAIRPPTPTTPNSKRRVVK